MPPLVWLLASRLATLSNAHAFCVDCGERCNDLLEHIRRKVSLETVEEFLMLTFERFVDVADLVLLRHLKAQ
jgi:hypothetical protein